jgi:hypothetical protein
MGDYCITHWYKAQGKEVPLGRVGRAEEVANVVCDPFEGMVTVRIPAFEIAALIASVYVAKIVGVKPPDENEVALNHPVIVKLGAPSHGTVT